MAKKSVLTVFLVVIMLCGLSCGANFGIVHASTQVGGIIDKDTTWTTWNSPYILTSPVTISHGTILRIEQGVTVNLNDYNMQISGALYAKGSSANSITFVSGPLGNGVIDFTSDSASWNEQAAYGCIVENAELKNVSISINNASPKLDNNTIIASAGAIDHSAILIDSGSPVIANNTIVGDIENLNSASPIVTNNFITGGIYRMALQTGSIVITNNIITGGSKHFSGAGIVADGSSAYIADNIVYNCPKGINAYHGTPIIERNQVYNNSIGVVIGGYETLMATIRNNTIAKNSVGVQVWDDYGTILLMGNNIEDNANYNMRIARGQQKDVDATNNWWGTTDAQAINQTIYDSKNNYDSTFNQRDPAFMGTVNYVPFLTAPNPDAMPNSDASVSTSNSTPTQSPSPSSTASSTYTPSQSTVSSQPVMEAFQVDQYMVVVVVLAGALAIVSAAVVVLVRKNRKLAGGKQ